MHQDKPRRHNSKKLHLDASSTNLELRSYDFSLSNQTSRLSERSFKRSSSIHDLFAPELKKDFRLSCIATLSTDDDNRERIDECKVVFLDDDRERETLSFETNQNSRNSKREHSSVKDVTMIMDLLEDRAKSFLDVSPDTQNEKNARLSLEYEKRLRSQSVLDVTNSKTMLVKPIARTNSIESKFITIDRSPFLTNTLLKDTFSSASSLPSPRPFSFASFSSRNPDGRTTPDSTRLTSKNSAYNTLYAYQDHDDLCVLQAGLNGVKPAIPPRDQKRAPARPPKDSLRLSSQNNNVESNDYANTTEPTQQQLHSIRKYQEQLRKRKDEEERQEILNRSLRGSTKLQALESHATNLTGQENLAYAQDELTTTVSRPAHVAPQAPLTYGEVVATLERLQLQLRNISGALGISGPSVEAELEAVRTLLLQSRFATAVATHYALKTRLRSNKVLRHHAEDSSTLARDCVDVLEKWQSSTDAGTAETMAAVEELTGILTSYDMEALLIAHDSVISYVEGFQRKHSPSSSSPSRPPSPTSSWRESRVDNIKIIRIEKTNEPLGATVRNDGDAVIIGRVVRGGAADKSGLLHEGDEVLEVNGVEMRGKSVNDVCDILAGMQGSLTFLVLPAPTNYRNNLNNRKEDTNQIQHIRAHFDYDPEEDPYIPCRELGVSFQKGDVLHVISQEDPNWWQAYREGEEDQTLAGLIPSKAFQHQRESMKQTIAGGKSTVRGSKKSSTLLCARKNPKKKKRNKLGANFNDDGYPLYATTTIDDYDSEEVLTYEEVALYYPRANHKRPIVLIGPPNIGRHELRQRLMQDSERFAAAIPHTSRPRKDSEVDGQDYHFISRSQFESDILCRKFVEHGEYEKAYYGTSVEAIRSVVNSGKICVLNLHPQSLKILRSSDLKPYVVFVAPPSLEKLRQKRIKSNESFKEEELKDIIEKAREMEDKYGHLFDMIIINNDTDRAYNQLLTEINSLEREPQWVPASWIQ
nr:protein PALS1 isoform X4 [Vespula vulgaris]